MRSYIDCCRLYFLSNTFLIISYSTSIVTKFLPDEFIKTLFRPQRMSAAYKVLTTDDLLSQICDYNQPFPVTSPISIKTRLNWFIAHGRNRSLMRYLKWVKLDPVEVYWLLLDGASWGNNGALDMLMIYSKNYKMVPYNWNSLLDAAAETGHVHTLEWIHNNAPADVLDEFTTEVMDTAAKNGHLEALQWLHKNRSEGCSDKAIAYAIKNGHLDVAEWLFAHYQQVGCSQDTLISAVQTNRLDLVQWVWAKYGSELMENPVNVAVESGNLEILKWLVDHCNFNIHEIDAETAAEHGHLEILQWMEKRSNIWNLHAAKAAIKNGHLHILQWLYESNYLFCPSDAIDIAIIHGHLPVVRWLHYKQNLDIPSDALRLAATDGHLEIVKWIHKELTHSCIKTAGFFLETVMDEIVCGNHVHIIDWLHKNCTICASEISTGDFEQAAKYGRVEMLAWLYKNFGNLYTSDILKTVVSNKQLACLNWLKTNLVGPEQEDARKITAFDLFRPATDFEKWLCSRYPGADPYEFILGCLEEGDLKMLKLIYSRFPDTLENYQDQDAQNILEGAVTWGHLPIIEWLWQTIQLPAEIIDKTVANCMVEAAGNGDLYIVKWMYAHCRPYAVITPRMIKCAARCGHLHILRWIFSLAPETVFSTDVGCEAVIGGHIHVLMWLHEKQIYFNLEGAMYTATFNGRDMVMSWLKKFNQLH